MREDWQSVHIHKGTQIHTAHVITIQNDALCIFQNYLHAEKNIHIYML